MSSPEVDLGLASSRGVSHSKQRWWYVILVPTWFWLSPLICRNHSLCWCIQNLFCHSFRSRTQLSMVTMLVYLPWFVEWWLHEFWLFCLVESWRPTYIRTDSWSIPTMHASLVCYDNSWLRNRKKFSKNWDLLLLDSPCRKKKLLPLVIRQKVTLHKTIFI